MTGQRGKPDFVVDPSGNVRDVRHSEYGSSRSPPGGRSGAGQGSSPKPRRSRRPIRTPYLIPIPVCLIIFLLVYLIRCDSSPVESARTTNLDIASSEYERGNRFLLSGEYGAAIVHFNLAIVSQPDVGDFYNGRALAYQAKGDDARALADFDQALELMPESALVYNNRALTYQAMGNHDQAIADLDRAIALEDDLGKAYYNRALSYLALDDFDRAIVDLDQAIQCSSHWRPLPPNGSADAGRDLLGNYPEELEAERYDAPLPSVYCQRGLAYIAKSDYSRAIADLRKAIELQPDLAAAQYALALAEAAAQGPSVPAVFTSAPTATAWFTATARTAAAEPARLSPAAIAVYVPQLHEASTNPTWENLQILCEQELLSTWALPGTYLYRIADNNGERLVVEQKPDKQDPAIYLSSCASLELDVVSPDTHFGELLTGPPEAGYSEGVYGCRPPQAVTAGYGTMSTTVVAIETTSTPLGALQTVRVDTELSYSFTTGLHDTYDAGAWKREWYACGYGLVRSTASSTETKNEMALPARSSEVTLVSYTPDTTNESHVRYILIDALLANNVDAYRAAITDEETAEALRRWDAGVRAVNIEDFERRMVGGILRIVYAGTDNPIMGTDAVLTTDLSP
jgi:tetratricopeptide (TPR) repeat protein